MERYPPSFYNQPRFPPPQQNPNSQPQEQSSKTIFLILGLVLFVIIGVLIYILVLTPNGDSSEENLGDESQQAPETSQSLVSCGDWNCFIDASNDCSKANFTSTISVDFFGVNITGTTYYELKGIENNQCIFYLKNKEYHINYTDEVKQQLLDSGATQEEIDLQEQQTNEDYDELEGRFGQCTIRTDELSPLLERWKDGNFSGGVSCSLDGDCDYTGDWELFNNCEGDYFSTSLDNTNTETNPDCNISFGAEYTIYASTVGREVNMQVFGFKGDPSQVSWEIENSSVATLNQSFGAEVNYTTISVGETKVIVTDNAVGLDCTAFATISALSYP